MGPISVVQHLVHYMRAAGSANNILSLATCGMLISNVNNRQQCSYWWSKVYGSSIRLIGIVHIAGKDSQYADALLRQPLLPTLPDNGSSKEVQTALFTVVKLKILIPSCIRSLIMLLKTEVVFMKNNWEILPYIPYYMVTFLNYSSAGQLTHSVCVAGAG